MAEEKTEVVELQDNFYRDSFGKIMFIVAGFCIAIAILMTLSVFLYTDKPLPVTFLVDDEMRVQPAVPLNQSYLPTPDVLQWVVNVLPKAMVLDFNRYNEQLKQASQYFTSDGWEAFLNQLNIYANYNNVQKYKLFVTATPVGAPYILKEGVIENVGRYGWWVQFPLTIDYDGYQPQRSRNVNFQILVVRVSTLNNLNGVAIDNIIQAPPQATQDRT